MVGCFFLDTSAIIKRYRSEIGSTWVDALTDPKVGHILILSEITLAETAAALAAMHRSSSGISRKERDDALDLFLGHCDTQYDLISATRLIIDQAVKLTQNYKLRGCDSLQLACGLAANNARLAAGKGPLTFVAADKDLLAAARAAGLATENPNLHPHF